MFHSLCSSSMDLADKDPQSRQGEEPMCATHPLMLKNRRLKAATTQHRCETGMQLVMHLLYESVLPQRLRLLSQSLAGHLQEDV